MSIQVLLVCGHMQICLEKLLSQHSLHMRICVMFVFTKKEKMEKLFQNQIWLLWKQTNKKCFFSLWLWANCSPLQISVLLLLFFSPLSIFKVNLMAYGKNLFNLLPLKKVSFHISSFLTLWSLILVWAC